MDREQIIKKLEVMSTDDTGNSLFEDIADYIEAEIKKAKEEEYARGYKDACADNPQRGKSNVGVSSMRK